MLAAAANAMPTGGTRNEIPRQGDSALGADRLGLADLGDDPEELLGHRHPSLHLLQAVLAERKHPARQRDVPEQHVRAFERDMPSQFVSDPHDLVNAHAAPKTGLAAPVAAHGAIERQRRRFSSVTLIACSVSCSGVYGRLQWTHSRRNRRCAMTPASAAAVT